MNGEARRPGAPDQARANPGESLAERAAAGVPPWARRPAAATEGPDPVPAEPAADRGEPTVEDEPFAEGPAVAVVPAEDERAVEIVAAEDEPSASDEPPAEPAGEAALALLDDVELRAALEAILLVVDEPVGEMMLAQVLEQPTERVGAALAGLSRAYAEEARGFDLRRAAGGWRLYTRPEYAQYVERFVLDGQQLRLTQAALETLAVVAYKQPVTRSRISAIRGVNCDGVIRTLVSRGLVEEAGAEPDSGAFLYRTTTLFLEKLGLDSVDQLPPLAPFLPDDLDELADGER